MPGISLPVLCLVTDRHRCAGRTLEEVVAQAVEGGVTMIQLREKDVPASWLLPLARRLRRITSQRAMLFINDRVDIALAVGADGVQLPEKGLSVEAARQVAGKRLLIGRSVHSLGGGVAAESEGADLLIVGTIFPTSSHPQAETLGLGILGRLAKRVGIPYLAIGGVTAANAESAIASGAAGVAVVSAISESDDPEWASSRLAATIEVAWTLAQRATMVQRS